MKGRCTWMTCTSDNGEEYRANFRRQRGGRLRIAVPMCKEHTRLSDALKETDSLWMSEEGWVYDQRLMMAALY